MKDEKKKFDNLPADGGDKIMVRFLLWRNERRRYSENINGARLTTFVRRLPGDTTLTTFKSRAAMNICG